MIDIKQVEEILTNVGKKYVCIKDLKWYNGIFFETDKYIELKEVEISCRKLRDGSCKTYFTAIVEHQDEMVSMSWECLTEYFELGYSRMNYPINLANLIDNIGKTFICKTDVTYEHSTDYGRTATVWNLKTGDKAIISHISIREDKTIICGMIDTDWHSHSFAFTINEFNNLFEPREKSK